MKTGVTGWLVVMVVEEDYWDVWDGGTFGTLGRLGRPPKKGIPASQAVPKPWDGLRPWDPWAFGTPSQSPRITDKPIKPVVWVCRQKWSEALRPLG